MIFSNAMSDGKPAPTFPDIACEDVLAFFKAAGAGCQRRINQVLRSTMEQRRKGGQA